MAIGYGKMTKEKGRMKEGKEEKACDGSYWKCSYTKN
jgi:hypothetical protein